MKATQTEVDEIELCGSCVACRGPLIYVVEMARDGGAPFLEPKESHAVQHGHGYLCASCAGHVAVLFERLREDRRKLEGAR
jgi:hypothetical protein